MKDSKAQNSITRGLAFKTIERVLSQLLTFCFSIFTARLLLPKNFGDFAIAFVFISIAQIFVSSAFSTAIIQKKDADKKDYSTMFWSSFTMSIIVTIIIVLGAPFIANYYNNQNLVLLLRVCALKLPLSAVSTIQHAYIDRNMMFKKYLVPTSLGTIFSGTAAVIFAYWGLGVWALVIQMFVFAIADIVILFFTVNWRPQLIFSLNSFKTLFSFGWKCLAADLIGTVFDQLRTLLIGKKYSSEDLAYYNKGSNFPNQIFSNISYSVISVLFPAISNISDDKQRVKETARLTVKLLTFIVAPMLIGVAAVAKPLIVLLYTEKWLEAVPFVRIFCFASIFNMLGGFLLNLFKCVGKSFIVLKLEPIKKVIYLALLITGLKFGVLTLAVLMMVYSIIAFFINIVPLKTTIGYNIQEIIADMFCSLLCSALMGTITYSISYLGFSNIVSLAIMVPVGIFSYLILSLLFRSGALIILTDFLKDRFYEIKKCTKSSQE